jgi:protein-S-isoprenylcysteine O-methyltransferase Ste14
VNDLYVRAVRSTVVGFLCFFAVIFIPAGTFAYWQGWAYFLTLSISTSLATIYIALNDEELLERRMRIGPTAERTPIQKIITTVGALVSVAAAVLMVLDHRFGWSPAVPAAVSILGNALGVLGILVHFFVVRENRFAAATVDVVEGQTVVSTGPYAIVRHPMYSGAILTMAGTPLALGSWWGLLFVPLVVAGFAWRLLNEERFLREHLPGYTAYMDRVRYRGWCRMSGSQMRGLSA